MITMDEWIELYIPEEELVDLDEFELGAKHDEIEVLYLAYLAEDH